MPKEHLENIKNSVKQVDETFLVNARADILFLIELVAKLEKDLYDTKREIEYLEDCVRYEK